MISWYLSRFRTMTVAELIFRSGQFLRKKSEQWIGWTVFPRKAIYWSEFNLPVTDYSGMQTIPPVVSVFGKEFRYLEEEIDWHRDPFTGESFPLSFAKNINIRSFPKASAKNVWEINRLLFLPQIAVNYRITGEVEYLRQFIRIITSWTEKNPYLQGVNWYSNIEVNIRLINWFFSWQILEASGLIKKDSGFKTFCDQVWLPAIYQHCYYSYHNPSRHSSANNHLVSEYAGLFIATLQWKFDESGKWLDYARKGLEKEIRKQHSSGINKEEAAEYIQFITDFFLLSQVAGKQAGIMFSEVFSNTLHDICRYISVFLDCKGNFPKYGDEDDGKCLLLSSDKHFNNFRSLLTSGTILFNDPLLKVKSNGFDLKNQLLFGQEGLQIFQSVAANKEPEGTTAFIKEGHFYLRSQQARQEIYLHFDAASLGYLSIAAHGHADALSFILNLGGEPFFTDPGTFTYHTDPAWRKYFIGTLAHNTIRVNRTDQALNAGPTLWINHYTCEVLDWTSGEDMDSLIATHNGYYRQGVKHTRRIDFHKKAGEIIITDNIEVKNDHPCFLEIPFHIHPGIQVEELPGNLYHLKNDAGSELQFQVDNRLKPELISGKTEPFILGWYSESFLQKCPAPVIYLATTIQVSTQFSFKIKIL